MKEIIVNVDNYNENSIKTIEGDNLSEVYKIYICKNKRRIDLTNKIAIMAYVNEYGNKKSNILALNITNASQGEIELPITNVISSENGVYACQVAIYGENNSLEQTAPFSLIVENNIFSKISNSAINSTDFHILSEAIKTTNEYSEKLKEGTENIELQYANKLKQINLDLSKKFNVNASKEGFREDRQGIVTFMCDDGQATDYTRFYNKVAKVMNVPFSICLVTSKIGKDPKFLNLEQCKELKNAGWTICSHTHNHDHMTQLNNYEKEDTLIKSKNFLKENQLDYEYFVIPYGESNNDVINLARKHYKAIVHTGGRFTDGSTDVNGSSKKQYLDNYYLYRRSTGEYGRTLDEMKADVDYALANGLWLIFIAHSWTDFYSNDDGINQLKELIDYIKNYKGANIVNFEDGFKMKGNVINKGNRYSPEDWYMNTTDGKMFIQSDISMNQRVKNTTVRQTFTPTIKGETVAGSPNYMVQHGIYKRNMDSIEFSIFIKGTLDDTIDGNVVISGLPSINKGGLTACNIGLVQKWKEGFIPTGSYIDNDGVNIRLEYTHQTGVHWHIQGSDVRNTEFSLVISGQYFVNMI